MIARKPRPRTPLSPRAVAAEVAAHHQDAGISHVKHTPDLLGPVVIKSPPRYRQREVVRLALPGAVYLTRAARWSEHQSCAGVTLLLLAPENRGMGRGVRVLQPLTGHPAFPVGWDSKRTQRIFNDQDSAKCSVPASSLLRFRSTIP